MKDIEKYWKEDVPIGVPGAACGVSSAEFFLNGVAEEYQSKVNSMSRENTNVLPDSGARTEYKTGAVRDASIGKGFPHMIPSIAIKAMARRFEDGARKYSKNNWMKGISLSHYIDSLYRHAMAWAENDQTEDHGGAVLWNMATAIWTLDQIKKGNLPAELNDLPYYDNSCKSET
jgi:hypothetical protein